MGQVLHGRATTTAAVRRAIQHSQESLRALARRYGINQKTVAKWKKRTSVDEAPAGNPVSDIIVFSTSGGDRRRNRRYAKYLPNTCNLVPVALDFWLETVTASRLTIGLCVPMVRHVCRLGE